MSARNRELLVLVLASAVASTAFATAWIAAGDTLDLGWLPAALALAGLFLVAHLVTRATVPLADPVLLPLVGVLCAIGLTFVYRIEPDDGRRQLVWVAVGVGVYCAVLWLLRYDYRVLERYRYVFGVSAVVLLMLPSVPVLGERINGVKLWVQVGPLPVPARRVREDLPRPLPRRIPAREARVARAGTPQGPRAAARDLGRGDARAGADERPRLGPPQLRDLPRDALHRDGHGRLRREPASSSSPAARPSSTRRSAASSSASTVWLEAVDGRARSTARSTASSSSARTATPTSSSRASTRSRTAATAAPGSGNGTFETVDGTPLIPYLQTDFIYSAIAQELGLVGAAAVLLLFLAVVARGMRIALLAQDGFSKLLAAGLTFGFALQTFIIVGGVLRLVPLTGITLPFVSYGGSSIVANFVMLALLLLVSNRAVAAAGGG